MAPLSPPMYPPLNPGAGEGDQKKAQLVFRESKYFQETESQKKNRRRPRSSSIARVTSRKLTDKVSPRSTRNTATYKEVDKENETTRYNEIHRDTSRLQRQEMCDGMEALAWKDDGAAPCTVTP